jgi:hypothetical protein
MRLPCRAKLPRVPLNPGLDSVEREPRLLDIRTGASGEAQVGVERRVPASQEAALDLRVLGETGLAHPLHGESIFLQRGGERVLTTAGVLLVQGLAGGERGASDGVRERLGLGLGRGRRGQGRLGFGRGGRVGEEVHFLRDGAAEVLEGLLDVGRVVVGFVRVVRTSGQSAYAMLLG